MAIYKNREVAVLAPSRPVVFPEQVTVRYLDGTQENVPLGQVKYTEAEKKDFVKRYPSVFDDITTVSDDDLKAVRAGVAPASDPSYKEQAEAQVQREKQEEENKKRLEAAKVEAKKSVDAKVNAPAAKPITYIPPQTPKAK